MCALGINKMHNPKNDVSQSIPKVCKLFGKIECHKLWSDKSVWNCNISYEQQIKGYL